ncbi:MAG: hypothetical protein CMB56_007030 [Methanobacteriota archaeon]|nr:MAG: hypothetical protein CMB56_007030 [Euryarchaeota archaeon]
MSEQFIIFTAFTCGLIGMGLGWKWGLSNVAGFFDSTSAVKYLMFGFLLGTIYAMLSDELVLRDYLAFMRQEQELTISNFLATVLISISTSLLVMILLTRKSVIATKSGPTSGWTLGLGIGAMFSSRYSYLSLEYFGIEFQSIIQMLLFVVMLPLFEGAICCFQGLLSTNGQRFKSTLIASISRSFFIMMIPAIFTLMLWWVVLIPVVMILYRKSVTEWIPKSLTQDAKRRYRRIMADNARKLKNL